MNRTIKEEAIKRYHCDNIDQLKKHLYYFQNVYNYAKKLKSLEFAVPVKK